MNEEDTSTPPESAAPAPKTHCGIVAVVGRTNAGKSTLVNAIVGEKVSIVSPVVQTTRNNIRAVLTDSRGQLVLIDTPGLHKSQTHLGTAMNRIARRSIDGVDAVLLVFDGSRSPQIEDDGWMRRALFAEAPVVFLLNKNDAGNRVEEFQELWESIQSEKGVRKDNVTWFSCSAADGRGVQALVTRLFHLLPRGPMLFDPELLTDNPRLLAIADVIREKYFQLLDDEIPHSIGIVVDGIREHDGLWDIEATLYVDRPSQKAIVIGPKGRMLRAVKRKAEPELAEVFGVDCRVNIWVKVEKNWAENHFILRKMGL